MYRYRFYNGTESFKIAKTWLLMETFSNKMDIAPLERTIGIVDLKNPFATYGLNSSRKRGLNPRVIGL